jgi:hypothetical protein
MINSILTKLANISVELASYETWDKKEFMEEYNFIVRTTRKLTVADLLADISYLTHWENGLYLIPIFLQPFIKQGEVLTCIDGTTEVVENIDLDTRGGFLAYGVVIGKS